MHFCFSFHACLFSDHMRGNWHTQLGLWNSHVWLCIFVFPSTRAYLVIIWEVTDTLSWVYEITTCGYAFCFCFSFHTCLFIHMCLFSDHMRALFFLVTSCCIFSIFLLQHTHVHVRSWNAPKHAISHTLTHQLISLMKLLLAWSFSAIPCI